MARLAGPVEFGVYSLVLGWTMLLASIAELGCGAMALRFVAEYASRHEYQLLRGVARQATLVVSAVGLIVAIGLACESHSLHREYAAAFFIGAPIIPLLAFVQLHAAMLQALKRPVAGILMTQWLRYGLFAVCMLVAAYGCGRVVDGPFALSLVVAVLTIVAFGCHTLVRRSVPPHARDAKPLWRTKQWFAVALPLFLVTLADRVFARSDVVMIGAFRPAAEVGFYAAALGLAATVELLMNAVIAVVAPDFAHLHAGGRASELQRTVTNATRLMFFAVLPFVLIMIVFGKPLLLLFGKSFPAAHTALSLLALAYLVNSFAGPLGLLLSQTGGHAAFAKVIIVTSAISMAVEVWLVASYGITGAAGAKLIAAILKSSALSIVVAMKTGIMPTIIGPRVRHLAAAIDPTAEGTH